MNKLLIELQKNCKATCVIINDKEYQNLGRMVYMDASKVYELFKSKQSMEFKKTLDDLAFHNDVVYFVIRNIEKLGEQMQKDYIGIVKDRNINEYYLPDNVVIVFTVDNKDSLKRISNELYHFCIVAF